jgi:hypothetical protein
MKQKFRKREFEDVFDAIALTVNAQRIIGGRSGYVSLTGPNGNSNEVSPSLPGAVLISSNVQRLVLFSKILNLSIFSQMSQSH